MANDWKKLFMYYSVLVLLALSIVGVIALRLSIPFAFACDGTLVVVDGQVTCQISGNNPGGNNGTSGGTEDTGTPGQNGGGGDSGGNKNNKNDDGSGNNGACTPGTSGEVLLNVPPGSLNLPNESITYTLPDGSTVTGNNATAGMCTTVSQWVDTCTGEAMGGPSGPIANSAGVFALTQCPTSYNTPPNPCDKFAVTSGGVTCTTDFVDSDSFPGSKWQLTVTAPWPGAEIHTRPYPVTLVNWDTAVRDHRAGVDDALSRLGYIPFVPLFADFVLKPCPPRRSRTGSTLWRSVGRI